MANAIYLKGPKRGISKRLPSYSATHQQYIAGTCCENGSDIRECSYSAVFCLIITILLILGAIGSTVLIVLKKSPDLSFQCPWYLAFIPFGVMLVLASLCITCSNPLACLCTGSRIQMSWRGSHLLCAAAATLLMLLASLLLLIGLKWDGILSWPILYIMGIPLIGALVMMLICWPVFPGS